MVPTPCAPCFPFASSLPTFLSRDCFSVILPPLSQSKLDFPNFAVELSHHHPRPTYPSPPHHPTSRLVWTGTNPGPLDTDVSVVPEPAEPVSCADSTRRTYTHRTGFLSTRSCPEREASEAATGGLGLTEKSVRCRAHLTQVPLLSRAAGRSVLVTIEAVEKTTRRWLVSRWGGIVRGLLPRSPFRAPSIRRCWRNRANAPQGSYRS